MRKLLLISIIFFCSCGKNDDAQNVPAQPSVVDSPKVDSPKVASTYRYSGQLQAKGWIDGQLTYAGDSINVSIPDTAFITVDTNNHIRVTLKLFTADESSDTFPYKDETISLSADSLYILNQGPRYTTHDTARLNNRGQGFYWNRHRGYDVRGYVESSFMGSLL